MNRIKEPLPRNMVLEYGPLTPEEAMDKFDEGRIYHFDQDEWSEAMEESDRLVKDCSGRFHLVDNGF